MKKYVAKDEIVIDEYDENPILRPNVHSRMKYDFDFRKKGDQHWRYLDSSDNIDEFKPNVDMVESFPEGQYRILISNTLEIVKTNVVS